MTLKTKLHRWFPHLSDVREHPHLNAVLGRLLNRSNLWHFNRRTVPRAVAIGLFWAFVPVPFQMLFSAFTAFAMNANLPVAVIFVWISNPITIPPLIYFCYSIGQTVTGASSTVNDIAWSFEWFVTFLTQNWQPFLLGCLIVGTVSAVTGYVAMRTAWLIYIRTYKWRRMS